MWEPFARDEHRDCIANSGVSKRMSVQQTSAGRRNSQGNESSDSYRPCCHGQRLRRHEQEGRTESYLVKQTGEHDRQTDTADARAGSDDAHRKRAPAAEVMANDAQCGLKAKADGETKEDTL